jgi:hypothetical protein
VSENTHLNPQPDVAPEHLVAEPESTTEEIPVDPAANEPTIGTGTSMALGCIAGTVLLIGFGLLFLFLTTLR